MTVGIVTDSTCDLPVKVVKQYGIQVVPLYINIGDRGFLDGVEITREDFYNRLRYFPSHPTTGMPSPAAYTQVYDALADEGAEQILCFHVSRTLSAVGESAQMAAKEYRRAQVTVVDSQQISMGTGFQVELAARLAREGKTVNEILAAVDDLQNRTYVAAALDTLEFLKRGGRMNGLMAGVGTLLQIKPILTMEHGIAGSERERTSSKARTRLIEMVEARKPIERLVLLHSNATKKAAALWEQLLPLVHSLKESAINITPVIGAHVGPGAVGYALISSR